jgi:hypothetical protein
MCVFFHARKNSSITSVFGVFFAASFHAEKPRFAGLAGYAEDFSIAVAVFAAVTRGLVCSVVWR